MDAAYSNPDVIDRVEEGGAVPFVDLNPRNSELLQVLKEAANALKDLSKKAVKEGLTAEERKAWLGEARAVSEAQAEGRVPVPEKKRRLRTILRKYAGRARRHGLTAAEQQREKRQRKAVMTRGTTEEKKVGMLSVAFGTIEWYLVYFLWG